MPNPGEIVTFVDCPTCCGSSSSSSSSGGGSGGSGFNCPTPCAGAGILSYSFTLTTTGNLFCSECATLNTTFTVHLGGQCGECTYTSDRFTLCGNPNLNWQLAIGMMMGVYTYSLTLWTNCSTFLVRYQGTAADCTGATVSVVSTIGTCAWPATITIS